MQKFTRALTREIEVGGERLALTLDEKGLSLRPVGSRKPPHEWGWPAVLCALSGMASGSLAADDDVAAALAVLKGAAAPKALGAVGPQDDILARLDAWLQKNRKRYHKGLLPGASDAELGELARAMGQPVPDELAAWLRWHNGQDEDFIGSFVESFDLMTVKQIIQTLDERKHQKGWNPAFVPILDDSQDDLIVLDLGAPGLPVREVWRGRDDHPEVATSMAGWLAALLADFEAGRYDEDPERGEFIRSSK